MCNQSPVVLGYCCGVVIRSLICLTPSRWLLGITPLMPLFDWWVKFVDAVAGEVGDVYVHTDVVFVVTGTD